MTVKQRDEPTLHGLRASIDELTQKLMKAQTRISALEQSLVDGAAVQATTLFLLERARPSLSAADRNAIRFAANRALDGEGLRRKLDELLADAPDEAAMKYEPAGRKR